MSKCLPSPFDERIPTYFLYAVNVYARAGIFDFQAGSPKTGTRKRLVASKELGRGPMTRGYKNFFLERRRDHQGHHAGQYGYYPQKTIDKANTWMHEMKKFRAFIVKKDL